MVVSTAEQDLIRQARNKDEDAFSILVETYQRPVYNLCYRMLGNEQEAEDAAQESFWRSYQALDRYDTERSFITWLLSIAAHYCIDLQRKRHLPTIDMDLLTDLDAPDNNAPNPEKLVAITEEQRQIQGLLSTLSEIDRSIIVMRYWHEFSEEEIGKSLNLTVSAVKSRLFRARQALAERWMETHKRPSTERKTYESSTI
jgi:RNA polymerase sigma-70 factor, ECF subfamily